MALNFGKLAFSVSFNPTSAFPIDARSYFESLTAAQEAAASAKPAGSKDSIYYYGQTLVVVENNVATFYIIQPNGTLATLGGNDNPSATITVDPKQFEYDEYGNLSLKGFNSAEVDSLLSVGEDGSLTWVKPIDAYTKAEVDNKISEALASADHLKRKIVESVADIYSYIEENSDGTQYIFMVPNEKALDGADKYDEYIILEITDSENEVTYAVEKVGSWEVNLEDYVTETELANAVDGKVDKQEGYGLISDDDLAKLQGLEESLIKDVDSDFTVDENGTLKLNNLSPSKILGLSNILNGQPSESGYYMISEANKTKLDNLIVDDDGNPEISGTVNAENVVGLADWLTAHAGTVEGLSENNFSDNLYSKLATALYINKVSDEFTVNAGLLALAEVPMEKVTSLTEALALKANQATVTELSSNVTSLQNSMTSMANLVNKHTASIATNISDIAELKDALTWKNIGE